MATTDSNFFEIQRRAFRWDANSTLDDGVSSMLWDADPNTVVNGNSPGETKLYSLPPGHLFFESAGVLWLKTASPNTWVDVTGGGSGSSGVATQENILMRVDPVGGTSPAIGTVVTTQAEYDALGADLKYVQDVYRILPLVLNHVIRARLAAGTHSPAPTNFWAALGIPNYATTITDFIYLYEGGRFYFQGVTFEAETITTVEASQPGTNTPRTGNRGSLLQRSAGTWTPDEHKGKWCYILTGAGAGLKRAIVSNTADTLTLTGENPAGACTFSIVYPNVTIDTSGSVSYLLYSNGYTSNIIHSFYEILFDAEKPVFVDEQLYFFQCRFRFDTSGSGLFVLPDSDEYFEACIFYADTTGDARYMVVVEKNVTASLYGCYLYGKMGHWGYPFILVQGFGEMNLTTTFLEMIGGVTNPIIELFSSNMRNATNDGNVLLGDGACTGVRLAGTVGLILDEGGLEISGCGIGLDLQAGQVDVDGLATGAVACGVGIKVSAGARVLITDPQLLTATTELEIDGNTEDYVDVLGAVGDGLEGQYGSEIIRK